MPLHPGGARLRASSTKGEVIPKYLVQASYIGDGVQGLRQEGGSARRDVAAKACSSVGGKLDAFYYAFGEADVVSIMDLPDNVTAAGLALFVAASGKVDIKTTVLLTPEEVDAAVKVGGDYRPPGG
ncbi:MAG: GYD domain-containing protein [Acidimicrobiales bacterium]